ncbi:protein DMP6-like [Mercurialis annua]|uniref:protein DMP6-like n=1 Tax=Mercurialis annua TaxID=3986 RepID=UPI00215F2D33|nr:protein DMP6-like [Mercurialis annua]
MSEQSKNTTLRNRKESSEVTLETKTENQPLPQDFPLPDTEEKQTRRQKAVSQTFLTSANLANHLPTGTVLAFQFLAPIFSNQGECDSASRLITAGLVTICGLSCILSTFTDSFRDKKGTVCYGFATVNGLWIMDGSATLPPELAANYKLRFIDFVHAIMAALVFASVILFEQNTVSCFYPSLTVENRKILMAMRVGIGVICSKLFVVFPTKRHGIGFPLPDA